MSFIAGQLSKQRFESNIFYDIVSKPTLPENFLFNMNTPSGPRVLSQSPGTSAFLSTIPGVNPRNSEFTDLKAAQGYATTDVNIPQTIDSSNAFPVLFDPFRRIYNKSTLDLLRSRALLVIEGETNCANTLMYLLTVIVTFKGIKYGYPESMTLDCMNKVFSVFEVSKAFKEYAAKLPSIDDHCEAQEDPEQSCGEICDDEDEKATIERYNNNHYSQME